MNQNFTHLHQVNISEEYTRSYDIRYIAEIEHKGLSTYRVLKDKDRWILENKINAQFVKWDDQYSRVFSKNAEMISRASNQSLAETLTIEAKEKISQIENLLLHTLGINDAIDWSVLKNNQDFPVPNPSEGLPSALKKIAKPNKPDYKQNPEEPDRNSYLPKLSFFDRIIKSQAQKKQNASELLYENAINIWKEEVRQIGDDNKQLKEKFDCQILEYEQEILIVKEQVEEQTKEWVIQRDNYYREQKEFNLKIDKLKEDYLNALPEAVLQYCEIVLNNSEYPDSFPKDFELDYNSDNRLLIVEYTLPEPESFPRLSEVKYIATKREMKEYFISDTQLSKIYENAIYNIALRTLHELFEADTSDAIDLIAFNGWVNTINKANGQRTHNCIVSVQSRKSDFVQIDLSNVDPKVCFKSLKGVGSSKLSTITAVQPLIQINKNDKRFVSSYDVTHRLDDSFNLALMDWEDFEHLIRELFEKEFSSNGGEVKVTQASRDGGVDAVAFDPDPIRGGKIVIQAKRYTNTVGVSAVRDLYGTVMNEGATKGILVSTADYGPDAYDFAKNKPLTLLNGSNLLFLLEKHGQKARIDLAEARKIQAGK